MKTNSPLERKCETRNSKHKRKPKIEGRSHGLGLQSPSETSDLAVRLSPGRHHTVSFCFLFSVLAVWFPAFAEFPLPAFTFYGEVRNAYGGPYIQADNAQVIVRVDGRECGRTSVDERLGPGINYRVEVALDDGLGTRYATFAARQGERVSFTILIGSQDYMVSDPAHSPLVGAPGNRQRINFFRDTDTDADGLPDTWEQMILFASNGSFTNVSQVRPGDDFDGDGVNNQAEFIAGTDPTWEVDLLALDAIVHLPEINSFGLGFYSVRAKTYELEATESFADWEATEFTTKLTNTAFQRFWRGDGFYSWLFVDTLTNSHRMFRLKAQ